MTFQKTPTLYGSCECSNSTFALDIVPTVRFICHCTICQSFTGKSYADMTMVPAKHFKLISSDQISFKKYRPPPNIDRGLCLNCNKPVVEFGGFGLLKWAFIPASNYESQELLAMPQMHIFYDKHVKETTDSLPKHSGYFRSQIAIGGMMISTI